MTEALSIICYLRKRRAASEGVRALQGESFEDVGKIKPRRLQTSGRTSCKKMSSLHGNISQAAQFLLSPHLLNIHNEEIMFEHTKIKHWSYQPAGFLLWPSPISSFYGLFCKALKIYKIKWAWVVGGRGFCLIDYFSKPYRKYQKNNNHSINFAPFETFLFSPLKEEEKKYK